MSYNTQSGNVNKEILIEELGLKQDRNTIFFENEDMIVLSPSIQNTSWWFDLLIGNVEKARNSNKEGVIILRLINELLVADLKEFLNKMVTEDTIVRRQNGSDNWKFTIKETEAGYVVNNQRNNLIEFPLTKVTISELVSFTQKYKSKVRETILNRRYFSIKTANPITVNKIQQKINPIEITNLNWYESEIQEQDIIFLVLGGDKSKKEVTWDNGFIALAKVVEKPYDQGYEKNNFKIKVNVHTVLQKQLKQADFIPYKEIYDLPGITPSTKGAPNQAIFSIKLHQAEILVRAVLDRFPELKEELKKLLGEGFISASMSEITYLVEQKQSYKPAKETIALVSIDNKNLIHYIDAYIKSKGFSYSKQNIQNLYLSLRTKPFVIISGISGTGKTKIVQLFAEAIGATEESQQFKLIPVRPDWSDSSELLGYTDIKGDFIKGPLTEMVEQAHEHPELPHFVLLDEMNLARVEYYFSDVLSVMESRKRVDGEITSSTLITVEGEQLTLPGNLYIIGTVNMDETTHPFSKKVLDRANTIEFNEIDLMNFGSMTKSEVVEPIHVSNKVLESSFIHLIDAFSTHEQLIREVSEKLEAINKHLEPIHAQVGYRVRDEISFYMAHNAEAENLLSANDAMDFCIMQKILTRVGGMEAVVRPVLEALETELDSYPRCTRKIKEMIGRFGEDGFTSFWLS